MSEIKGHLHFMYLYSSLNFLAAILRPLNDMLLDFKMVVTIRACPAQQ